MPMGRIFGSNNGPKPQPLTSEKEEKSEKSSKKEKAGSSSAACMADIKDSKGSTVKLGKKSYTVEKKLAEGGFAIVYLVCDKHGRNYALKRQLIRDDQRQVEACRTESQIVKNLNGHKNIIAYVDHQLTVNKAGVYDYMLLTIYYPTNVLQLMNSRLLSNRWLTVQEILDIFCDVCEAVARLHHSKTPVIHRDLKVENVLIDQRSGSERQIYVLCDYGSATTKTLSKDTFPQTYIEEEIQRYTTLSYRAPEMIDLLLHANARHRPNIFQASHLAFSAAKRKCPVYNIEKSPRIELAEAVRILHLKDKLGANYPRLFEKAFDEFENQKNRKQVTQTDAAGATFSQTMAAGTNPALVSSYPGNVALDPARQQSSSSSVATSSGASQPMDLPTSVQEGVIVNTEPGRSTAAGGPISSTTSVNPRLRPKPTASSAVSGATSSTTTAVSGTTGMLPSPFVTSPRPSSTHPISQTVMHTNPIGSSQQPTSSSSSSQSMVKPSISGSNLSFFSTPAAGLPLDQCTSGFVQPAPKPAMKLEQQARPAGIGSVDVPDHSMKLSQHSVDSTKSVPEVRPKEFPPALVARTAVTLPANTVPPSTLRSSAFQPYSITASSRRMPGAPLQSHSQDNPAHYPGAESSGTSSIPVPVVTLAGAGMENSNPFMTPGSPPTMDDTAFGERFDELRRVNRRNTIEAIRTEQAPDTIPLIPNARPAQGHTPTPGLAQMTLQKASQTSSCSPTRKVLFPTSMEQMQIEMDPFGNAPAPHQVWASKSATSGVVVGPSQPRI
ncbi:protein kinase domain-containing protein [Ditylenchus destructor]|nr:protein kinase domain-containing protein [Ditylenchus destructor]